MMKIDAFVREHGLHGNFNDFCTCLDAFRQELTMGLAGGRSSLKMLPSYIDPEPEEDCSQPLLAMDVGGTNLRVALIGWNEQNELQILRCERCALPGTQSSIDINEFYDLLAEQVVKFPPTERIGMAFSFPSAITPQGDGRIISFNKEIRVQNANGSLVGEGLCAALRRRGISKPPRVTVLNDTTATLLAGRSQPGARWSGYLGFVLGTGLNACYVEKSCNVTKDALLSRRNGKCIINTEASGFDRMNRSAIDREFDATTREPGQQQLEKLISGEYIAPLLRLYIQRAAEAGCFSAAAADRIELLDRLEARHITGFGTGNTPLDAFLHNNPIDRAAMCVLVNAFLERGSMLIAAMLTALILQGGGGRDSLRPVCISCDGSLFAHCSPLREKITRKMRDFAGGRLGIYGRFIEVGDATLIGAAIAAALE